MHAQSDEVAAAAAIVLALEMELLQEGGFSSQDFGYGQVPVQRREVKASEAVEVSAHGPVTRIPAPHILDAFFCENLVEGGAE